MDFDKFYMIGTEKEVRDFSRIVDFGEKKEIQKKYESLKSNYKACVDRIILKLNKGNEEFFGYNLNRFLLANKYTNSQFTLSKIGKALFSKYDQFVDNTSLWDDIEYEEHFFEKKIDSYKKNRTLNPDNELSQSIINTICSDLLCDIDLLTTGIGKVWEINELYYEKFVQNDEFWELVTENFNETWNAKLCLEFFEKYLQKNGKLLQDQPVLIEQWAVLTYSGKYQMLKPRNTNASNEKQEAIDMLIEDLHNIQLGESLLCQMYATLPREDDIEE
ncbi:hypothetical protein DW934_12125 [Blautia obeum]|uniref:hypothetical protein n=1 Tax=Blautia obeum TaxID=40520 RepID=UPI000E492F85|nr:hypothetical protein [Blautia obeum]RHA46674.1 hypothetical protein DW934_12125 [Blautia obeum]